MVSNLIEELTKQKRNLIISSMGISTSKSKKLIFGGILSTIIIGGLTLYAVGLLTVKNSKTISQLKNLEIPSVAIGEELVYQSPKRVGSVELYYSGNGYTIGIPMKQNISDWFHNIWRLPISEIPLKMGRNNFKFKLGDQFESQPERVAMVDNNGNWVTPPNANPIIMYPTRTARTLRIYDPSATSIELTDVYGYGDSVIPLTYKESSGMWEVENLELNEGRYIVKINKNGQTNSNLERVIFINKDKKIIIPTPLFPELVIATDASPILEVLCPKSTSLSLKGSFDNFAKEHPLTPKEDRFVIDIQALKVSPGMHQIEFVTPEGPEPNGKTPIYVDKEGKVYFPKFNDIENIIPNKPSNKIKAKTPEIASLGAIFSSDGWEKTYPLEKAGEYWEGTIEGLTPGRHEFKFKPNGQWESRDNRVILVEENGLFSFPEAVNPKITSLEGNKLKVKATKLVTLSIRTAEDWNKDILGKYNEEEELWEFDLDEVGIDKSKDKRILLKFLIDGVFETGPNRFFSWSENKLSAGRLTQNNTQDPATSGKTQEDKNFGSILKIAPDPKTSLRGQSSWIKDMKIYHLWVKSFRDSRSGMWAQDSIGDLRGIREAIRGNYFSQFGINSLWLSPIFSTKGEDQPNPSMHGYDVLDNYKINVNFGDTDEFKTLLSDAHSKGIRIILDVVPNHVSDLHPWFVASRDPNHPDHEKYKDYFIWLEEPIKGWEDKGLWGTSSLNFCEKRKKYYYSIFGPTLPDLNYSNPEVQRELINNLIYWFNMGVDGVRVDAIKHVFDTEPNKGLPKTHHAQNIALFQKINETLKKYEELGYAKLILGENYTWDLNEIELYGKKAAGQASQASINFAFAERVKESLEKGTRGPLSEHLRVEQADSLIYPRFISNHDNAYARPATAYGVEGAKLACVMNILNPGPYIVYYGEELGMEGSKEFPENLRTPIDWSQYALQSKEQSSFINFYKKVSEINTEFSSNLDWQNMRVLDTDMIKGKSRPILPIIYMGKDKCLLVVYNLGDQESSLKINLPKELTQRYATNLLLNSNPSQSSKNTISKTWDPSSPLLIENLNKKAALVIGLEEI